MEAKKAFLGFGIAFVVAAIALGLYTIGTPADARARRLDERRVRALQVIAGSIDQYWRDRGQLPPSIAELMRDPRSVSETKDPVSGQPFAYRIAGERRYELCADFAREASGLPESRQWAHPAGRHCFELEVHERPR